MLDSHLPWGWGRWGFHVRRRPKQSKSIVPISSQRSYLVVLLFLLLMNHVPFSLQKVQQNPSIPQSQLPRLIFANRQDIRRLDFNRGGSGSPRGNTMEVVGDLIEATALDIHYRLGLVCFSDIEQEKIQCSSFNTSITSQYISKYPSLSNRKITIASDALPAPEDLVCDHVTSKLYFSDPETKRIEVVSMFPPYDRKVLVWEDIDQPRALALAPHMGLMFWSDWGEYPKIERGGMDGKSRKTIVDQDIFWPNGIALNPRDQELFWVDAKLLYIVRVDFNGQNRLLINHGAPLHPFALAYYADFLYWTDWHTNNIHIIRADGKDPKTIITSSKQKLTPMDLVILEEQTIPTPIWEQKYRDKTPCEQASCSHLCLLSPQDPYYTCACPIGIKLINGSHTQCSKEITNFLLVARGNDIRRISLDTEDYTDVVLPLTGIKHVLAVDYDVKKGFIYWTDDEATGIRRAQLDGSQQQDVVKEEILHPDGICIDNIAENLYWTDAGTDRIEVSRLDGRNRKILISRGLQEPRAIQVDPARGLLFWSDWGKKAKIERSFLDGSERRTIVNHDIFWPNGLALDVGEQRIYFSDAKSDKIEMINYDGTNRMELINEELPHIFGLALLGDYIYWTDWQRRTLERANKRTGEQRMTIKDPFSDPMGLIGINIEDKSHSVTNPCSISNGGCQHLCLYKPNGTVCACASGYELTSDNKSCLVPDAFLVFSRDGDLHRISLNRSYSNNLDDVIPVSKVKAAGALDFDILENRIYWSDTKVKAISRAYMNGSETERIVEFGLLHPEGIAVDWLSRLIFWSDMGRNRIECAKLNGAHRRTILWSDVDTPRSIAVHPSKGLLYFALWRTNSNPTIEVSALDGTRRQVFIDPVGRVQSISIDFEESFMYWTDIDNGFIAKASLEDPSRTRQVIQQARDSFKPSCLAQYQDFIYWSDMSSQSIQRANKTGGENQRAQTLGSASNIVDMGIYHSLKQQGWNPCSQANCSHLCFTVPLDRKEPFSSSQTKAKCGCPTHYTLSEDGTSCSPPQEFLLFSAGSTISRLVFDTPECPDAIVIGGQQQKQRGIGAVAWGNKFVYWIDPRTSNIKKATEHGTGVTALLNAVDENFKPFDIVFDAVRRLLFFSCESYNSINVTDANGQSLGSVLSSNSIPAHVSSNSNQQHDDKYSVLRPRHLALNALKSQLYFSNDGRIERMRLDGMDRVVIYDGLGTIEGIAVDVMEGMLFWTGSKRIESSDLDGSNRKVLVGGLDSPGSIAVMGRYVYWIEERSGVERVEKWTGDEKQRVIPRTENAKYILYVNESHSTIKDPCRSLQCSHVCIEGECSCFEGFVLSFEDHQTCVPRSSCADAHEFTCLSGRVGCVPLPLKCDGKKDCADGSDENECETCEVRCPCDGACFNSNCLKKSQLCDGREDCLGTGWDESEQTCSKISPQTRPPPMSPVTTILVPVIILVFAVLGAGIWYCIRNKSILPSEESTEPLNHPGTNLTTLHTTETLHQFPSTNGSSIASSPYCELLVPHPSPATDVRSFCCHGNYAVSYYNRIDGVSNPPPTPCSTNCDNSDIYSSCAPPPSPHISSSPHSTIRSLGGAYPPPPSPVNS